MQIALPDLDYISSNTTVAYPEVNLGTLRARSVNVGKSAGGL